MVFENADGSHEAPENDSSGKMEPRGFQDDWMKSSDRPGISPGKTECSDVTILSSAQMDCCRFVESFLPVYVAPKYDANLYQNVSSYQPYLSLFDGGAGGDYRIPGIPPYQGLNSTHFQPSSWEGQTAGDAVTYPAQSTLLNAGSNNERGLVLGVPGPSVGLSLGFNLRYPFLNPHRPAK